MAPLVAEVYGPDYQSQLSAAKSLMQSFASVDQLVDIDSTVEAPQPLWQLVVDQQKAAQLGVSVATVSQAIQMAVQGVTAGYLRDEHSRNLTPVLLKMQQGVQADWQQLMRTNLDSLFNMSKQVVDAMSERGWGRVINVSSVNGSKGAFGQTNYSAAKAGVLGFTKALAAELASKGVTVNAIAPGYIGTDMVMAIREDIRQGIIDTVPMKRLGRPDEIGDLCAYLASDKAAYITGATININGGLHMC